MSIVELLTGAILALGGGALLLQSKALPSDADATKAKEALDKSPLDPAANTTFGKYTAFVLGDYSAAMPYLVNSGDKTLKTLADHELDASYTASAPQKIGMGDEWVVAAKKFPPLNKIFYDRASQWYGMAWPELTGVWKDRTREQLRKILQNPSVPDPKVLVTPSSWKAAAANEKAAPTPKSARTGKLSYQMIGRKLVAPETLIFSIKQPVPLVPGKTYEFSAWVLSDDTDGVQDQVATTIWIQGGKPIDVKRMFFPADEPWWHRLSTSFIAPPGAIYSDIELALTSSKGNVFFDDISLKSDGKELIKNGSFEDK